MWVLLAACGPSASPGTTATEAFDVPPPPGARTIRLVGPHPHPIELGQTVALYAEDARLATGDVVDHTDAPPELILYVAEGPADAVLVRGGPITVVR